MTATPAETKVLAETWVPAYIGLGSNLDGPVARVRAALDSLAELPQSLIISRSSLYGSKPLGGMRQDDYCNAVAGILTRLPPEELLAELRKLELRLGRQPPRERWGPRHIDLDLLAWDSERRGDATLTLPHPGIVERNFVLYPWCEIAPDFRLAGLGTVRELAGRRGNEGLWQL